MPPFGGAITSAARAFSTFVHRDLAAPEGVPHLLELRLDPLGVRTSTHRAAADFFGSRMERPPARRRRPPGGLPGCGGAAPSDGVVHVRDAPEQGVRLLAQEPATRRKVEGGGFLVSRAAQRRPGGGVEDATGPGDEQLARCIALTSAGVRESDGDVDGDERGTCFRFREDRGEIADDLEGQGAWVGVGAERSQPPLQESMPIVA